MSRCLRRLVAVTLLAAAACDEEETACVLFEVDGSVSAECADFADCALLVRGIVTERDAVVASALDACARVAARAGTEQGWTSLASIDERALAACSAAADAAADMADDCVAAAADGCDPPVVTCIDGGLGTEATAALALDLATIAAARCQAIEVIDADNGDCFRITIPADLDDARSCESDCLVDYFGLLEQYTDALPSLAGLVAATAPLVPQP